MSRGIITLLTDFGTTDPYVAAMKGVALSVNPDLQLVDISHEINPHDVAEAGYIVTMSYGYFPPGTVHAAVVDPGVGSERRILAAEVAGQVLMAPDNGLLTMALAQSPPSRVVNVTNADYFHHPVSMTFHGRDVFAPVAAHLTLGVDLGEMGAEVQDYERLEAATASVSKLAIDGQVIHVDRFGNLVTNITRSDIAAFHGEEHTALRVHIAAEEIAGVSRTYAEVGLGELLAVVGSTGLLEISANRGSAADVLGVGRRAQVRVTRSTKA
jgi:S-adenosylmethionine hydrolase